MLDDDAGLRAVLFTDHGGRVLDAMDIVITGTCRRTGAVRTEDAFAAVRADEQTKRAAVDYIIEIGAVRVVNPPGRYTGASSPQESQG